MGTRKLFCLCFALFLAAGCLFSAGAQDQVKPVPQPAEVRYPVGLATFRPALRGRNGVMVGGSYLTTAAGMRIMQAGGTAMDAAAAMILAASVVEHSHYSFGSQTPILVYEAKTGKVSAINGIGTAPGLATLDFFLQKGGIPGGGILGGTIPPMVGAVIALLDQFGTKTFAEVAKPALEYAEGYPFTEYLKENIEANKANLTEPTVIELLKQGRGRFPEVGEIYSNLNLAATIRTLIEAERSSLSKGRSAGLMAVQDEFYKGSIAKEIVRFHMANGGLHRMSDYENYKTKVVPAVSVRFGEYEIFKQGPWTQGPALLEMLNILEGFNLKAMGHNSADYIHVITETMKLALADRDHHFGDPDFSDVPLEGLLSKDYAAERRKLIRMDKALTDENLAGDPYAFQSKKVALALARGLPEGFEQIYPGGVEGTTCINVADKEGNLVSVTPSGPTGWVTPVLGNTGILQNNRMGQFVIDDQFNPHNVVHPGQRPRVTLTPSIILKNGKPWAAISTPGTERQDQAILQVFLNMAVFGMNPQVAVEAARVETLHLNPSGTTSLSRAQSLEVETRITKEVRDDLSKRGHKIRPIADYGMNCGVTVAMYDQATGALVGGVDVRRDRYGISW